MNPSTTYPHVTMTNGDARIDQTRYKVIHLAAEHYHHGWTAEELLRQHPDLRPEQVYSALAWFYDHFDDMVIQMNESADRADQARSSQTLSRDQLMQRKQGPRSKGA